MNHFAQKKLNYCLERISLQASAAVHPLDLSLPLESEIRAAIIVKCLQNHCEDRFHSDEDWKV